MAALRSRRLEALLGAPVDRLSSEHIEGLVKASAQEAFDMDYKLTLYGRSDADRRALASDVAALANTAGGVIVVGVQEDDQAQATAAPGVAVSDAEIARMRQIVASLVSPMPVFDVFSIPKTIDAAVPTSAAGGEAQSVQGYLVVAVPRSPSAPHAVLVGESLRYPRRNGATTRYLSEPEVATAYRDRMLGARRQQERIEDVRKDALRRLTVSPRSSWLFLSLVPSLPGEMTISQEMYYEAQRQLVGKRSAIVHNGVSVQRVQVGHRRLLVDGGVNANGFIDRLSLELHADGAGTYALRVPDLHFTRRRELTESDGGSPLPQRLLDDESIVIAIISGLLYLGQHARDRAAAGGAAALRAEMYPVSPEHPTAIGYSRGGFAESWTGGEYQYLPPRAAEADAPLDALAEAGPGLVAAAALLSNELGQAFGLPEMAQLSPDGRVRHRYWGRAWSEQVQTWADSAGIEVSDEEL
ncbi:ATP-binding protein [Micromonospora sp. NPDC047187]|uniref:AlbA family DNA-binding domain-containing protein n=1 Tax=Micromonospora TaxID=1873 RepID=UPI0033F0E786